MLRTISGLQGVNILSKDAQKQIKGRGPCGVKVNGEWCYVTDTNGSGGTRDEAVGYLGASGSCGGGDVGTVTNWCCDSCPWNS